MKRVVCFIICILALFTLCCCTNSSITENRKYDLNWIIGKTPEQIKRKYGEFDEVTTIDDKDGNPVLVHAYYHCNEEIGPDGDAYKLLYVGFVSSFHGNLTGANAVGYCNEKEEWKHKN